MIVAPRGWIGEITAESRRRSHEQSAESKLPLFGRHPLRTAAFDLPCYDAAQEQPWLTIPIIDRPARGFGRR
jgi:hypothetical protein